MSTPLPFFNWSLKKALDTEQDSFSKAQIRIVYSILLFSVLKALIVIGFSTANEQWLQVYRAIGALILYILLIKILLYRPVSLKILTHIMLTAGVLIVWTNIFVYAHKINLVTVEFVFMIVLSSFYILNSVVAFTYSILSILPVILFLAVRGNEGVYLTHTTQEFMSPGFEIIVVLNFTSIVVSHYLFYRAFKSNIKEKEKLNAQLQLSIAEANKLAETKSVFLSTISHELRTPLNSVIGITELLIEDNPEERQKENLKILQFSAQDLLSLINNVLDINKIDSEKLELEAVPFRLTEFIQNRCSGLRLKANDKNLHFVLDIDKQLDKTNIISDPTRLSQVIYNLVSNAIKFTDKGTITVKLECIRKTENTAEVLFSVTDTGIGIHPDRHQTVFELFSQAESHITRTYGGTGLGLAIVKQVLTLFHSTIQLESVPGKGSRFSFTILFTTTAETPEIKKTATTETPEISHLKILIAEDNELNRLLMRKQLERFNITPVMVGDGREAYEAYLSGNFDAIFMDLHMPELDGYEATKLIRMHNATARERVCIIAFTATVTEQQKIFDNGFDDFLYKPVNMNDLHEKLKKIAALNPLSLIK